LKKKIFITGGAGYIGSLLTPYLLEKGYKVKVFDTLFFGNHFLPKNDNLIIVQGDIRDNKKIEKESRGYDYFVHLACISNDSSFILDENLSKSINFEAFEPMVIAAKKSGIQRFIYASTSSVYGVSKEKNVKEDHPLVPLTLYNKFKGLCEPILFDHTNNDFEGVIFRPATVCGYAPRLRLDLSVNILANYAYHKKKITVFGGDQLRPNLNIKDYCSVVDLLLNSESHKITNQIFNVGYENMSINQLAELVKKIYEKKYSETVEIVKTVSDDNRSYHINSDKIGELLNFKPKFSIDDAVESLFYAFENIQLGDTFFNDIYYNVKRMQNLKIK
jgi:nucleoside-diphosphate-sugar epimerase